MEYMLQYFTYDHLPERLQEVSRPFAELAKTLVNRVNGDMTPTESSKRETTVALRKLLEAKDAAVRSRL